MLILINLRAVGISELGVLDVDSIITMKAVIEYYNKLLSGELKDRNRQLMGFIVCEALILKAKESFSIIKSCFENYEVVRLCYKRD